MGKYEGKKFSAAIFNITLTKIYIYISLMVGLSLIIISFNNINGNVFIQNVFIIDTN